VAIPFLAVLALALRLRFGLDLGLGLLLFAMLVLAVVCAIHHAEVVAHRVGEPIGTLVLTLAVTIIELALILSLMLAGGRSADALARDTVFAAIMIACNGVVGLSLVAGALRHHVLAFQVEGTSPGLGAIAVLAGLMLVVPSFTATTAGPTYSPSQLAFVGVCSFALYALFVFAQTVRHRDYFQPVGLGDATIHIESPPDWLAWTSLGLLLVSLVGVVGLAKSLAPALDAGVAAIGAPKPLGGALIALIVTIPETIAALRAALGNRMQSSLNLALGSGLASIGLTIPAVTALSFLFPFPLVLGVPPVQIVLLTLTLLVSTLTLGSGRATVIQGAMHLVLFSAFLLLVVVP